MHNTNATLWRRIAVIFWPRHARAYLPAAVCLASALLILACIQAARAKSPQLSGARYVIETRETATFYVGKQGKFDIVLLDQNGNRLDAPTDLKSTITVTTLDSLEEAKDWLASKKIVAPRSSSLKRAITLPRGHEAAQVTVTHRRREEDETIHLLSNQPGRLRIFVESENVATGETIVLVLDNRLKRPTTTRRSAAAPPAAAFMHASWQVVPAALQDEGVGEYKLDFLPAQRKPRVQSSRGEQIAFFRVELLSANNESLLAPQDIQVILRVEDGYAYFVPETLIIPRGQAVTKEQTELRTRPGGLIKVGASPAGRVNNARIIPVSRTYEFTPGIHSTSLAINKQRESAYANGLDEIELQVVALQDGRAIAPEEEGMDERRITLGFKGDSQGVKFENGKGEVVIPKGQVTGTIKLFSARPTSGLKVVADSWNGLRDNINAGSEGIPINFSFPWFQLLCAMLGGVTLPLLRMQKGLNLARGLVVVAQGLVVGVIFFGLALFGAILSNPQKLGAIPIALTKLPTENAFASFILGFLGSTFLLFLFKGGGGLQATAGPRGGGDAGGGPRKTAREKPRAPAKEDDVREAAPAETVGGGGSRTRRV